MLEMDDTRPDLPKPEQLAPGITGWRVTDGVYVLELECDLELHVRLIMEGSVWRWVSSNGVLGRFGDGVNYSSIVE